MTMSSVEDVQSLLGTSPQLTAYSVLPQVESVLGIENTICKNPVFMVCQDHSNFSLLHEVPLVPILYKTPSTWRT